MGEMFREEPVTTSSLHKIVGGAYPGSFLGESGKFYVRVTRLTPADTGDRFHDQTAVYPSIESYNGRSITPEYVFLSEIVDDFELEIAINMDNLKVDGYGSAMRTPPLPEESTDNDPANSVPG